MGWYNKIVVKFLNYWIIRLNFNIPIPEDGLTRSYIVYYDECYSFFFQYIFCLLERNIEDSMIELTDRIIIFVSLSESEQCWTKIINKKTDHCTWFDIDKKIGIQKNNRQNSQKKTKRFILIVFTLFSFWRWISNIKM